jgi:hypothetical protein
LTGYRPHFIYRNFAKISQALPQSSDEHGKLLRPAPSGSIGSQTR